MFTWKNGITLTPPTFCNLGKYSMRCSSNCNLRTCSLVLFSESGSLSFSSSTIYKKYIYTYMIKLYTNENPLKQNTNTKSDIF